MNCEYQKKPIVIEAFQMTRARRDNNKHWPVWLHQAWQLDRMSVGSLYQTIEEIVDYPLSIGTLEGQMLVSWNDWIIRGVKGEIYPCKPDIFAASYGAVEKCRRMCPRGADHPIVKLGFKAGEYDCPMCGGSGNLYEEKR